MIPVYAGVNSEGAERVNLKVEYAGNWYGPGWMNATLTAAEARQLARRLYVAARAAEKIADVELP